MCSAPGTTLAEVSGIPLSVLHAVDDALFGPAGAPTLMAILAAAYCWISAQIQDWAGRRKSAVALQTAGLLTVLVALVANMHRTGWLRSVDRAATGWAAGHRTEHWDALALVVTDVSSPVAVATASVVAATLLSRRYRSLIPGAIVVATVGTAALAGTALQAVVTRPDPPLLLPVYTGAATAGAAHVAGAAALLGVLAVFVTAGPRPRARIAVPLAMGSAAVMGAAWVYSGRYWLSDILACALVAAVVVRLGAAIRGSAPEGMARRHTGAEPAPDRRQLLKR